MQKLIEQLKRLHRQHQRTLIMVLFLLLAIVLVHELFQKGLLTLEGVKAEIGFVSSVIQVVFLFVGGILAYIKFFSGRDLVPRADLELRSKCFPSEKVNTYWLEICLSNRGNVSIYDYRVNAYVRSHCGLVSCNTVDARQNVDKYIVQAKYSTRNVNVADIGETSFEYIIIDLPKYPRLYTFEVIIEVGRSGTWRRCLTVENP